MTDEQGPPIGGWYSSFCDNASGKPICTIREVGDHADGSKDRVIARVITTRENWGPDAELMASAKWLREGLTAANDLIVGDLHDASIIKDYAGYATKSLQKDPPDIKGAMYNIKMILEYAKEIASQKQGRGE